MAGIQPSALFSPERLSDSQPNNYVVVEESFKYTATPDDDVVATASWNDIQYGIDVEFPEPIQHPD